MVWLRTCLQTRRPVSALRWLGWGHHRAAAPPPPPSLSGSRPLFLRPRSTPTDREGEEVSENGERKKKDNALFCFSPSFPSKYEPSSHLLSQRCFYHHWNPHIPLQTCPLRQTESRAVITEDHLRNCYFWWHQSISQQMNTLIHAYNDLSKLVSIS